MEIQDIVNKLADELIEVKERMAIQQTEFEEELNQRKAKLEKLKDIITSKELMEEYLKSENSIKD